MTRNLNNQISNKLRGNNQMFDYLYVRHPCSDSWYFDCVVNPEHSSSLISQWEQVRLISQWEQVRFGADYFLHCANNLACMHLAVLYAHCSIGLRFDYSPWLCAHTHTILNGACTADIKPQSRTLSPSVYWVYIADTNAPTSHQHINVLYFHSTF